MITKCWIRNFGDIHHVRTVPDWYGTLGDHYWISLCLGVKPLNSTQGIVVNSWSGGWSILNNASLILLDRYQRATFSSRSLRWSAKSPQQVDWTPSPPSLPIGPVFSAPLLPWPPPACHIQSIRRSPPPGPASLAQPASIPPSKSTNRPFRGEALAISSKPLSPLMHSIPKGMVA